MPLDRRRKPNARIGDEPVVKPLSAAERLQLANLTSHPLAEPLGDAGAEIRQVAPRDTNGSPDLDPPAKAVQAESAVKVGDGSVTGEGGGRGGAGDADDSDEDVSGSPEKLYRQHIFSAHYFAERAEEIEGRGGRDVSQEDKWRHRSYVSSAIMTAAAFLEASINELYRELQNLSQSGQRRLPQRELAVLTRVWPEIAGSPILHRYQVALSLADADSYDESRAPFLDAENLIRLREALLSCTPDWDDSRGKHHTLEKRLRAKFPPNALAVPQAPWFPDRCLGVGAAKWSVRVAHLFSDDFCHRMGIPVRARVGSEGAA